MNKLKLIFFSLSIISVGLLASNINLLKTKHTEFIPTDSFMCAGLGESCNWELPCCSGVCDKSNQLCVQH